MGCLTALMGVACIVGGMFLPWPIASVLCGIVGVIMIISGFMQETNG